MNEKLQSLIDDIAKMMAPLVKEIEDGIKTTQNNYGRYGALLSQFSKGDKSKAKVISLALIKAGANVQGVENGLKLFV